MILDTIVDKKKETLEEDILHYMPKKEGCIAKQMKLYDSLFVIGEIKKASPSKGLIVEDFNVQRFAAAYDEAGINAISILTEKNFFQGSLEHIELARSVTDIPILRKDFIMDAREIVESKRMGANIILLITAMLNDQQLKEFYQIARLLDLECIVEIHNEEELQRALRIQPEIIGINNRNLHTFEVSLHTTRELIRKIPKSISVISESGIHTHEDMEFVKRYGADAVLIGESFMRSDNIRNHLKELKYGKD